MTSLLLLSISIIIALGFARYNKSNKLFWILLVSLLVGFTGCKMVSSLTTSHKSEANVKSSTTPMLTPTCSFKALETEEGEGTIVETKSAGKDTVAVDSNIKLNFGEDEHITVLTEPPQLKWLKTNFIFDTS